MTWSEVEAYQQLQQDYDEARKAFLQDETAYRDAVAGGTVADDELEQQYAQLAASNLKLEEMHDQLRQMRHNLAQAREEVSQKAAL
jgi:uncharacterized protein YyaL (SSP411 family)